MALLLTLTNRSFGLPREAQDFGCRNSSLRSATFTVSSLPAIESAPRKNATIEVPINRLDS